MIDLLAQSWIDGIAVSGRTAARRVIDDAGVDVVRASGSGRLRQKTALALK